MPHTLTLDQVLERYTQTLTTAVVSEGYAEIKTGFEREAKERASAFQLLIGAQDRTNESIDQLQRQLDDLFVEVR